MDLFIEGQKLTLFFQKNSNMVEMTCVVEKVFEDRLDLSLPQYFMRYIEYLQVGSHVTAKAFSKFGTIDFNTIVISSPLEDTFTIELDYNSVKLTSGSSMQTIKAVEQLRIKEDEEVYNFKTFELSTECVKFVSERKWAINAEINCSLILPQDYGIINFKAILSEIDPIYDNEYKADFVTMTEKDRQTLLFYMYKYGKDTN